MRFSLLFLISSVLLLNTECSAEGNPFRITVNYNHIDHTNIDEKEFDDQDVRYAIGKVDLDMVWYYNPSREEGSTFLLGYTNTYLNWEENPDFDKSHFNTLTLGLGGFTNRLCDWLWKGFVKYNIDTDNFEFDRYSTWDLLLWGRKSFCLCHELGFHIGFYAQTGMKMDRVYPVIGFDWYRTDRWKVNLIFPMDLSVIYLYNTNLSLSAAIRFFESRHRTGNNEPKPRAQFAYRNYGAEFGINYDCAPKIFVNAHIGSTLGGHLKISDKHYGNSTRLDLDPALYYGGEISYRF